MNYKQLLRDKGIRPRKKLGQNFLVDNHIADEIVNAAALKENEVVAEIGPGLGILTERILNKVSQLTVIEKDQRMRDVVEERFSDEIVNQKLKIIPGDALKVDWESFPSDLVVISNLPYQISTPILFRMLELGDKINRMVLMFQKEVGDRLVASPGTKAYGALSVFIQVYFKISTCLIVPATSFFPPPKITSIVLSFVRRKEPAVEIVDQDLFRKVVKGAFANRRKTLLNNLKMAFPDVPTGDWESVSSETGIDFKRRGETLDLGEFSTLTKYIQRFA